MDIGSIFLILALLILVIIFIIRPVIERSWTPASSNGEDLSSLLAERDQVVSSIQELDDDYHLGKVPIEDYSPQRQTLLQNGVDILRKIDGFQMVPGSVIAENRLEAALEARRQDLVAQPSSARKNGNAVPPVPDDDLEQKIATHRRAMQSKAAGFCPKCGRPVQANDRFCPRCGAALS